jgi:drug/metabolite transporter superfamily protein YnfA
MAGGASVPSAVRGTVLEDGIAAGAVAAAVSGAPSTLWAVAAGGDPLEATLAAGSMLLPHELRRGRLLAAAVPVHLAVSLAWGIVLSGLLPSQRTAAAGAIAGLAVAAFDLGMIGRRFPRVRALPLLPQLADHVLFGTVVGYMLERRRAIIGP